MYEDPKQRRADAEQEAQEFADYIAQQEEEPLKKKPPVIEESRVVLQEQPFNLDSGATQPTAEGGGDGGGGGGPPDEPIGACCFEDGTCTEEGELLCADGGGEYQGDDTDCDSVDCPVHEGACCPPLDDACTIETPSDCTGLGGTYQGDDTDCDPNPCSPSGCYKITSHNISYNENHWHYPCYTFTCPVEPCPPYTIVECTPDFGDASSSSEHTSIIHYGPGGVVLSVECEGYTSSSCSGAHGCCCPDSGPCSQCTWSGSHTGDWSLCPPTYNGCCDTVPVAPFTCSCPGPDCGCFTCPIANEVCINRPPDECQTGRDCTFAAVFDPGSTSYCYGSSGFCNSGEVLEYEPCP